MARAITKIYFEKLKLGSIISFTLATNSSSVWVMKKIVFEYQKDIELEGEPHVLYGFSTDDYWKALKNEPI